MKRLQTKEELLSVLQEAFDAYSASPSFRKDKKPFLFAIDGRCGAGKSTLALWLRESLAKQALPCLLFRMDDFFLPPEMRTAKRLSVPGKTSTTSGSCTKCCFLFPRDALFPLRLSVRRREGRGKDHRLPRAARDHRGKLRLPRFSFPLLSSALFSHGFPGGTGKTAAPKGGKGEIRPLSKEVDPLGGILFRPAGNYGALQSHSLCRSRLLPLIRRLCPPFSATQARRLTLCLRPFCFPPFHY